MAVRVPVIVLSIFLQAFPPLSFVHVTLQLCTMIRFPDLLIPRGLRLFFQVIIFLKHLRGWPQITLSWIPSINIMSRRTCQKIFRNYCPIFSVLKCVSPQFTCQSPNSHQVRVWDLIWWCGWDDVRWGHTGAVWSPIQNDWCPYKGENWERGMWILVLSCHTTSYQRGRRKAPNRASLMPSRGYFCCSKLPSFGHFVKLTRHGIYYLLA